jgi:hypothetical protein
MEAWALQEPGQLDSHRRAGVCVEGGCQTTNSGDFSALPRTLCPCLILSASRRQVGAGGQGWSRSQESLAPILSLQTWGGVSSPARARLSPSGTLGRAAVRWGL